MTKFNPEGKEVLTYGECLHPAMKITDQADADQYFKDYVAFTQKWLDREPRKDNMTAEQICRANLGYFAGYYDHETSLRIGRLYSCSHPIFGNATSGQPTSKEARAAGEKTGSTL